MLLPKAIRLRLLAVVHRLERWPQVSGAKPLRGSLAGHFRVRTGDYRVQFHLDGEVVVIEKIAHRDRFYEASPMVAQSVQIAGKRLVILEESDYLRLCRRVRQSRGPNAPALPPRNRSGRRPAAAYILASIARDIIADRKAAGLTQQELAKRAGIRQETLSRIESGKHPPTLKTLKKIDRALGKDLRPL